MVNFEEHAAVVCVRRSACERVTEMDELVGRLSLVSRLPQYLKKRKSVNWNVKSVDRERGEYAYLTTAMLTGAVVLAW